MEQELVGKTIKSAEVKGHSPDCDGTNVLTLTMEGGEVFFVVGSYGTWTSKSCEEYPEEIFVTKELPEELH